MPFIAVTCYAADSVARAGSLSALLTPETLLPAALAFALVAFAAVAALKLFR